MRGSILLVDDEEGPIEVEKLMLKELGYSVITAENGMEAIDIYAQNSEKVDLVALDMIMPEMSGKATYEELKKINPAGLLVRGSAEEKVGYKSYHNLDEFFEALAE